MNLAAVAVENRTVTYFFALLLLIGGVVSFFQLGQLEDPEFTVKTAVITTGYPGASPEEVELEVTDRIELALQEMAQIDYLESFSRAGISQITVNIKEEYWSDRLPQVWDEMRRQVRDIEHELPPGTARPVISDDFGDVFGFQLAVTGDGFSYAEIERYVKELKRELSVVYGVARVDLWGVQQQVIYVDVAEQQLTELGLTDQSILNTLAQQNMVVDAGSVDLQSKRYRIAPSGEFRSPEEIADLVIHPSLVDEVIHLRSGSQAEQASARGTSELIRIGDIATVRRGYREPPMQLMRFNGEPSIGISITNLSGVNVVEVGRAIDRRLAELLPDLPIGIEVHRVHWMSDIVDEAVSGFLVNFAQAVAIVLVVIAIGMGWKMGLIIGTALIGTVLGVFILLALFGIDLQRMSLGALIIALGMMVDNAIVVADGYAARLQRGMDSVKAAVEGANQPSWPLLGATVIAVMAFYPIFASDQDAGEFLRTLFTVVAIALLFSWVVSMTVTPLQCIDTLKTIKGGSDKDPYDTRFYRAYRDLLALAIHRRWLTIGIMVGLLVMAVVGFGNVKQLFFPDSSMEKFMIDYWAPEGTRIQTVAAEMRRAEERLQADERVKDVASFIGAGPPRFYLPVDPESPNPAYGQLIVNVHDFRDIDDLIAELTPWLEDEYDNALLSVRKYGVGPDNTWQFEVRISGPAKADPGILRALADEGIGILKDSPLAGTYRTDWRQRRQTLIPEYNQNTARWTGVTRPDLARTTKRAFDGTTIGLYREGDDLIPIVGRHKEEQRTQVSGIEELQIMPELSLNSVPLAAVTDGVRLEWEDTLIGRRDRRRTITVQGNPIPGVTLPTLRESVVDEIEKIELPPGYTLEWGGEYEDTIEAQASLIPGMVPAAVIILFTIVVLFNAVRPPIIILLTVPFAVIGITVGLLAFNVPFGFVALLGAMSLAGMMIKNAIVLLDEINLNLDKKLEPYQAVIEAGTSRLRPVVLAAATTVLGVIPLLQDVFWIGLAVTIMAGLSFGTILTLILLPTLYATLYRIPSPTRQAAA